MYLESVKFGCHVTFKENPVYYSLCRCSSEHQRSMENYQNLVETALAEAGDFCEKNTWISDIDRFCSEWTDSQLSELQNAPIHVMEVSLITTA